VKKPIAAGLVLVACLAVAAGCGSKKETTAAPTPQPLELVLDFFPNADHAPLYSAISHGDFRAVGLDVQPQAPAEPAEPLKLLAAGRVDAAISYEPELLLARDQGLKLVSIGALVQRPLTSIIALPSKHVSKVADLARKRVGTAGIAYQKAELQTALQSAGVKPSSVREVNVGFNLIPAMLSGRVDATLGAYWNYEAIQLRLQGRHPNVIHVENAGVPPYDELVLVRDISFHTLCMHHLLPFFGQAHVAYLPGERILGISKLARVVETFARDLQLQERMTVQIADWLEQELRPRGVGVVLSAEHTCMTIRGVLKPGARTVTSALRGSLRDDPGTRQELFSLVG